MKEEVCCPKIDVKKWDDKLFNWKEKRFIKRKVKTLFFMPMNFGKSITKLMNLVEESNAKLDDNLCLSDHTNKWNMDIYLAVDKEVKGAENVALSGKYYSKVYEGPFKDTNIWCENFKKVLKEKDLKIKKWYMWYTTCPKCAKKYGKNYTVIIAEVI